MKGKNKKNNKKKVAVASVLLALFAILAGTFAWTSYTEWVKNHMQSKGFEEGRVTVVEEFDGDKKPIDENPIITKKVSVVNSSSADAFVRISFEEMLHKLADGAKAQTFTTPDNNGFPVIVSDKEIASASYTEATEKLVIKDTKDGTAQTKPGSLKFYISNDGKTGKMINIVALKKADLPNDFVKDAIPTVSGKWEDDDVMVAQKVTGYVHKMPDGTWETYTSQFADAEKDKNFAYHGYGVGLGDKKEADWAGASVNVAGPATPGTLGKSSIDPDIQLVKSGSVGTELTDDWYYNDADGYFYYTKVLKASATTDSTVLEKIMFPKANDNQTYKLASYNLWVGLEAIPASQAALSARSEFGAYSKDPANPSENLPTTTEGSKTWQTNGGGWGLVADGTDSHQNDNELLAHFKGLATIVE